MGIEGDRITGAIAFFLQNSYLTSSNSKFSHCAVVWPAEVRARIGSPFRTEFGGYRAGLMPPSSTGQSQS
jgi:hypothetical protein